MLSPSATPEISVVIPCLNEEENAAAIANAVTKQLEHLTDSFEIIFIDNGSTDGTAAIVRNLCARDARIRLIINTRNFGQLRSPAHALFQARGRGIIGIAADFQDPPELIPDLVQRWRAGTDIVLGVSETKKTSPLYSSLRKLSYDLQRKFGDYPIIPNATGFGIYDAKVIRTIGELNEPEPFVRGLLVETGYTIDTVAFKRPDRAAGRSKNGFFALLDFALSALAYSSKGLLRAPLYFSFIAFAATIISMLGAAWSIAWAQNPRMWMFAALLEFQFGLLFLFLGILGVQVRLISDRTRGMPLVIERERVNFAPED
ncbi:glycosyltransferase family 2 protein [Sphingobium fuliginis]|uniref:Glycosyl transferase n=1 Tax=Sphingobium fuliginis (strain ATCC 27551) TaxID=336203 RepID=A0ABQ1ELZ9_SPHSA|nr:glycosyltransferase family 2 protein [Sphingobium fuliginis]RYM01111.1 glycosyltransferase [Sphingobium fuliginis]GFZ77935.1 glycosyl transferase [Sphingobium fuliginis]